MTSILHTARFLELAVRDGWEFVRRRNATAVVGIIATTPAGELLLVEQQRLPVGGPVIELPAGLVGDEQADEDLTTAAARELVEETGWEPDLCTALARGPSSAGLTSEVCTLVRATGLRRVGTGGGVAGEAIIVHAIPLAEVAAWLAERAAAGVLIDHKIQAALWWISRETGAAQAAGKHGRAPQRASGRKSMPRLDLHARISGALIGTLVGDALGVPVEFTKRSVRDQDPVRGMRGFGCWNQPPGTWSDDGAMTLVAADTLATAGWDLQLMMGGFCRWLADGLWTAHGSAFDIGSTTRQALVGYQRSGDLAACGQSDERSNGNGSLMRCLPVSLWLAGSAQDESLRLAGDASALTHAHQRSRLCCAWHAQWCEATLEGGDVRSAASAASNRLRRAVPSSELKPLARILDGTALDLPRAQVISDGYVVSTLEAALWCLAQHHNFEDTVLAAVNLGEDTDTTGAVVGGMAGWLHGLDGIPEAWRSALPRQPEIMDLADRFARACLANWGRRAPA
ncbi:MAG TPA: hypothetical protein DCS97_14340 [Planctomycetes bacterium]|nr:hypothetical protein [Planctomycetota bacterium]